MMLGEDGTCGLREWAILQQVISRCSEAILLKHYKNWTSMLTQALKVCKGCRERVFQIDCKFNSFLHLTISVAPLFCHL